MNKVKLAVATEMRRRGMTNYAVAKRINVGFSRLNKWLNYEGGMELLTLLMDELELEIKPRRAAKKESA